jgi:hypothetical protein
LETPEVTAEIAKNAPDAELIPTPREFHDCLRRFESNRHAVRGTLVGDAQLQAAFEFRQSHQVATAVFPTLHHHPFEYRPAQLGEGALQKPLLLSLHSFQLAPDCCSQHFRAAKFLQRLWFGRTVWQLLSEYGGKHHVLASSPQLLCD